MNTITAVVLTETERDLLRRVAPLVPLAYPTSADPAHLRPAGMAVVDEHDRRLRVVGRLATEGVMVTYPVVQMLVEVVGRVREVVTMQADPSWWLGVAARDRAGRARWEGAEAMAEMMAAERAGQQARVEEAWRMVEELAQVLTVRDDPGWWVDRF